MTVATAEMCFDCKNLPAYSMGLCHTCYERMRRRAIAAGKWESMFVDATPTRKHIFELVDMGYSVALIANLSDTETRTISRVKNETYDKVSQLTEERILAIPKMSLWYLWKYVDYDFRMPSGPASRRLRALATDGWTYQQIGDMLGWDNTQVARYALRPSKYVHSSTMRHISKVYETVGAQITDRVPRRDILMKGWPGSMEWDDIDNPDEEEAANYRAKLRVRRTVRSEREAKRRTA